LRGLGRSVFVKTTNASSTARRKGISVLEAFNVPKTSEISAKPSIRGTQDPNPVVQKQDPRTSAAAWISRESHFGEIAGKQNFRRTLSFKP
jgi:hypothetical protein